jgi:hypothetical protein
MSANLEMRFTPGLAATTSPIDYFLTDIQGHVFQGEKVLRMNIPRGLSYLELSVKGRKGDPNTGPSFPILAELDGVEISEIDLGPGSNHP